MKTQQAINNYFQLKNGQFLVLGMPEDEGYFDNKGCAVLRNGLSNKIYDVSYVVFNEDNSIVDEGTVKICHEVLSVHHNGEE